MSNIDSVINMIKLNPDYEKNDMIEQIMLTLKVTRSNAQVYIYNAHRKMGTAPNKEPSKKVQAVVAAAMKTAKKGKYLPGQVAVPTKGDNKTREQVLEEFAKIEAECEEFERTHEKHPNGITYIKKKNLETMKEVTRKHKALERQIARATELKPQQDEFDEEATAFAKAYVENYRGKTRAAHAE